jgi:hypothetical protein
MAASDWKANRGREAGSFSSCPSDQRNSQKRTALPESAATLHFVVTKTTNDFAA